LPSVLSSLPKLNVLLVSVYLSGDIAVPVIRTVEKDAKVDHVREVGETHRLLHLKTLHQHRNQTEEETLDALQDNVNLSGDTVELDLHTVGQDVKLDHVPEEEEARLHQNHQTLLHNLQEEELLQTQLMPLSIIQQVDMDHVGKFSKIVK